MILVFGLRLAVDLPPSACSRLDVELHAVSYVELLAVLERSALARPPPRRVYGSPTAVAPTIHYPQLLLLRFYPRPLEATRNFVAESGFASAVQTVGAHFVPATTFALGCTGLVAACAALPAALAAAAAAADDAAAPAAPAVDAAVPAADVAVVAAPAFVADAAVPAAVAAIVAAPAFVAGAAVPAAVAAIAAAPAFVAGAALTAVAPFAAAAAVAVGAAGSLRLGESRWVLQSYTALSRESPACSPLPLSPPLHYVLAAVRSPFGTPTAFVSPTGRPSRL